MSRFYQTPTATSYLCKITIASNGNWNIPCHAVLRTDNPLESFDEILVNKMHQIYSTFIGAETAKLPNKLLAGIKTTNMQVYAFIIFGHDRNLNLSQLDIIICGTNLDWISNCTLVTKYHDEQKRISTFLYAA